MSSIDMLSQEEIEKLYYANFTPAPDAVKTENEYFEICTAYDNVRPSYTNDNTADAWIEDTYAELE